MYITHQVGGWKVQAQTKPVKEESKITEIASWKS